MPRWAWEFQNEYVLASIMVNGGDILSEDEDIFLHSRALPFRVLCELLRTKWESRPTGCDLS